MENFKLIITMDSESEKLHGIFTSLKARQPALQQRLERDLKYRTDMAMSVSCAGIASIIRVVEQLGGHPREHLMAQVNTIIKYYLDHPGFPVAPPDVTGLN